MLPIIKVYTAWENVATILPVYSARKTKWSKIYPIPRNHSFWFLFVLYEPHVLMYNILFEISIYLTVWPIIEIL